MTTSKFSPFPELSTDRFLLRQVSIEDDEEIYALRSDDRVNEFLNRKKALSIEDAREHIRKLDENYENETAIMWAIVPLRTTKLVGSVCFWNLLKQTQQAEIGYELLPPYHGKGIMQEILPVVIEFGLNRMNLRRIEAELDPANIKSIRLLEKYGFVKGPSLEEFSVQNPEQTVIYSLEKV